MSWDLHDLKKKLAANDQIKVDITASDPRLAAGQAPKPGAGKQQPESDLEARLLFQLKAMAAPLPILGWRFDTRRRWRFDFAWPDLKLAVEAEGGIYGVGKPCPVCGRRQSGGHTSVGGFSSDREKYNAAQIAGWIVLSYTPKQIRSGEAVDQIIEFLNREGGSSGK